MCVYYMLRAELQTVFHFFLAQFLHVVLCVACDPRRYGWEGDAVGFLAGEWPPQKCTVLIPPRHWRFTCVVCDLRVVYRLQVLIA